MCKVNRRIKTLSPTIRHPGDGGVENGLDRQGREIRFSQDGDGAARSAQGRVGGGREQTDRRGAGRGDQVHRAGVVADGDGGASAQGGEAGEIRPSYETADLRRG